MSTRYTIHNGMVRSIHPKAWWKTRSWALLALLGLYLASAWGPGGAVRAQTYCAPSGTFYAPLENAGRNYSPKQSSVATVPRYARGSVAYTNTSKVGASSASFNGTSQYVRLDSLAGTAANSFLIRGYNTVTVMFWVQAGRTTGVQTLFEEGTNGAGLGIRLNNANLQARIARAAGTTFNASASFPTDGAWHHIALTWGGGGIMRLYLDGVEVDQDATIGTTAIPNHNDMGGLGATMGNGSVWGALPTGTTTGQFFQGRIDDFFYSYGNDLAVLNATQIQSYIACVNSQPTNTFTCDGSVYIPQGVSGQPTDLKQYNYATNLFENVDTDGEVLYNAAGYNQADHFIYAIQSTNVAFMNHTAQTDNNLVRIGKDGMVTQLGPVAALPSVANGMFHVGDISPTGVMYVNDGKQNLYRIDLNNLPYTATTIPLSQTIGVSDIAWNPMDGFLYGVNATTNLVMKINPSTGAVTTITPNPAYNLSGNGWGAVWFDQFNNFYTYYNSGVIDRISLPSGQRTRIKSNAPTVTTNDAAACPFSYVDPQITKTVFSQSGNTVTFEIELQNNGPSIAADVMVRDILPAQLLYQSAQVLNENGQVLAAAGNYNITAPAVGQTGTVQLHLLDLNVGAANKRTLRITARLASGCNATVNNCAEIISTFGSTANNGTLGNTADNTTTIPGDVAANNESCTSVTFAQPDPPTVTASTTGAVCSGESFSITYTSSSPGQQVAWVRLPDGLIGTGSVTDAVSNTTTAPQSYTYNAWVVGVSGCNSTTITNSITVNPVPIVTPSTCSQTICSGEAGNITFESSIPGSTIHWLRVEDNLTGTGDISEVMNTAGTFTYKIWAESPAPASCPSSTTITCEVVVTPGLEVTAFASSETVCVGSPLSLSAAVVPAGNYTYAWSGPNGYASTDANPTVSATAGVTHSGSYTVVVTDAEGCSGTAVVNAVVENCCPIPEPVATVSLCNNETLNLQTYVPAGGTFTQLTGTAGSLSGSTFNGIVSGAGVFKVGYRPAGLGVSCAPDTITVVVRDCTPPPCNYPVNAIVIDASCGNSDGRAELTLGGISENAMTSFAWSNGQVGSAISGLSAGVYSVTATVTDGANICSVVDSIQVNNIGGPVAELRLVTAASCSVNGAASLSLVSGTGPFTVSWTGAATGSQTAVNLGVVNITNLPAGAYVFRISSAATPDCFGYLSVNIPRNDDTRITLTATATDASSCTSPSGSIVINVQPQVGVTAPFSYSLNGQFMGTSNLPTYTINNLPAGVYTVSASSADGCSTSTLPVIIKAADAPAVAGWTAVDPACPTDQGMLVFAGGQSGTTFQVREAKTGAIMANNISGATSTTLVLPAGTYITQTVSGTCVSADTLILSRPQEIKFNVQYTAETCADGGVGNGDGSLAVVQITGGTKPYTIVVTNDQGQTFGGDQLTSLPAGNYSVNVTDSQGCSGGDGTLVTVPPCGIVCPSLDFNTVVLDAQCEQSNGEATAQLLNAPSGATVTYQWSNGFIGPVTTGLTSGIYSVTAQITSSDIYNGCKYEETVNVNAIGGPVFTVSPVSPASCTAANGSAVVNLISGTAPFTVSWTGPTTGSQTVPNLGSTTINNLKAGDYVFTVTGAGSTSSCIGIYEVTILQNSGNLAATPTASAVSGCGASDGQISVNVTGGVGPFSYIINGFVRGYTSNRTFSVQGLPAGTYYVEVTDRNGCTTVRNNVLINTTGESPIAGVTSTSPLCPAENGTIVFAGTGNATDQYTVTVAGTATQIGQTAGNVAATYSVPGGTYLISRTTSTGCVSVTTVTVTQPEGLDYNIQYALPTCEAPTSGSLAVVQANGGTAPYSVTVTGAEGVVSDLTALSSGSYTVTLGDANGCTLSREVSLTIVACCNLEATLAALPLTNCENVADGSLEITYSGSQPYEYNLNGGSFQPLGSSPFSVTGLAAGTYTVVIQAVGDPTCTTTLSGTIVTPTAPVVSTVVVTNPTDCTANNGGLAIVLVNSEEGIFQYSIDNGGSWQTGNTFSGLIPGNYTVLVRNAAAPTCFVNAGSFTIQAPGGITADIGGQNQDVCALNQCTITITASGGSGTYEYSLDGGLTWSDLPGGSITRNNLAPSNYLVVVRDKAIPSCQVQELVELATEECPVPVVAPFRLTGGE